MHRLMKGDVSKGLQQEPSPVRRSLEGPSPMAARSKVPLNMDNNNHEVVKSDVAIKVDDDEDDEEDDYPMFDHDNPRATIRLSPEPPIRPPSRPPSGGYPPSSAVPRPVTHHRSHMQLQPPGGAPPGGRPMFSSASQVCRVPSASAMRTMICVGSSF